MSFRKLRITVIIILAVLLSISYAFYSFDQASSRKILPVLGQVHEFRLREAAGNEYSLKNLEGKIWTANFFFTTCADICPIMTKNMAALHRSFEMIDDVHHVSITVHPEFDSTEVLDNYAQKFKANQAKWHFLTGTRQQIKDLALKSFKLGSIEEPVFHSANFALVDQKGLIRGYYDGVQSGEVSELFRDISHLLKDQ